MVSKQMKVLDNFFRIVLIYENEKIIGYECLRIQKFLAVMIENLDYYKENNQFVVNPKERKVMFEDLNWAFNKLAFLTNFDYDSRYNLLIS